jgi:uncharacterized protein (TIGR02757 family)
VSIKISKDELKDFLEYKVAQYNNPKFIQDDPICIPHKFSKKEDIEIAGFLVATISWGNRKSIIKSGEKMIQLMGESPYDFATNAKEKQLQRLNDFVHRTFNGEDFLTFIKAIRNIYKKHGGLEQIIANYATPDSLQPSIHHFKNVFFEVTHNARTQKHVADPFKNSAAKKINMWLRWMVRDDKAGVDFGIWKSIKPAQLSCPLDVHSGNVARKLGLISRIQNDSKALNELDSSLRKLDANDPVKYDFALFGLGVFENF